MRSLLIFSAFIPFILSAQSPGGVSGCEAWLVTSPVGDNLNGSHRWLDLSGDSAAVSTSAGLEYTQPRDSVQSFKSAITFNAAAISPLTKKTLSL